MITKLKNIVPWTYVISNLKVKKLLERLTKKNCEKTSQKEFTVGKAVKRKGDKLYVKWKNYDNSFNRWMEKKDIV